MSGLPLIVTAHGYDATLNDSELMKFPEGRMLLQRSKHLAAFAKRFVCVSDFLRSELLARGYPDDKLLTLPLGVNLEELTARPADQLGQGIIAVGRLVEKKGMRYLIEAYAALPAPLRAAHPLTIIGDGPLREALVDLARDLALSIEFTGSQPRHDVLRRVRRARVFCLPSVRAATGDAEGMGIVIMEALAQGVPAVIFAGQPMAPLLAREKAGLVAIDADAQDLAAQIGGILQDDAMARHFSRRGRAFCERHFSLRRNVDLLEELYSEVTGR
jgi:glycosyltransferase involved in cell wall biosynthesis